ncbi:hypothetical protein [Yersinia mollaretii]|nr:hypothetical protein [Yersinia mollaretii]
MPAKSALEQWIANRAGSLARKTWEVYPQGNISRKARVLGRRPAARLG